MKDMNMNEGDEKMCVDEWDIYEWKRWVWIKEISVDERDEYRWKRWVLRDLWIWMKEMNMTKFMSVNKEDEGEYI